jgi:small subunit ribosomal protein S6
MEYRHYETVFILTPVLSQIQVDEVVDKFKKLINDMKCEIINEQDLGIKRLAYPIKSKNTGIYRLLEFRGIPSVINKLEVEYSRDERILRFMTITLDKHGVEYNIKKREMLKSKENIKE